VFGLLPFLAVHLLGRFDIVAAWVLPAFGITLTGLRGALALRRAVRGSNAAAIAAGLVLAATAYTAYYYVVYEIFFAVTYLAAGARAIGLRRARRRRVQRSDGCGPCASRERSRRQASQ
jgi:hypothetical protein